MRLIFLFLVFVTGSYGVAQIRQLPVKDSLRTTKKLMVNERNTARSSASIVLANEIQLRLQSIVNRYKGQPSTDTVWINLKRDAVFYLDSLYRTGKFAGNKPEECFFVKTGVEVTSQQEIAVNIKVLVAGYALLKPAEFSLLRFYVK
ncbi:hypothetical protein ESA94_03570 [Lacibacter luteus]|uniref:Uncharacterized protein n=1 Tax=Lacibacter luteus TaxID=2508719 RepID=A0A4Q1CMS8_9BACT|nr:hypothetical protein [Lacibacter luteus]RXK62104.1 hypothetical protein ESA94_03570 [Lacibacter luteus]